MKPSNESIASYRLLGVEINPMTVDDLNALLCYMIRHPRQKRIIASQNLHSVYFYHNDPTVRAFQNLAYKRIDGIPFICWGRFLGLPLHRLQRVTWVDYLSPFIRTATEKQWRVFYVGSKPDIAAAAAALLHNTYPDLPIEFMHGYFDKKKESDENRNVIRKINAYDPDILLTGMGMPLQEHWIYNNFNDIHAKVILTCGAAMEYITGAVAIPPRWMGRYGLEWLFRLAGNPSRFAARYCMEPWHLAPLFVKDLIVYKLQGKIAALS